MRLRELAIIFLSLILMLAGLALPLWWNSAMPVFTSFPAQIAGISNDVTVIIDLVKESINGIIRIILDNIKG